MEYYSNLCKGIVCLFSLLIVPNRNDCHFAYAMEFMLYYMPETAIDATLHRFEYIPGNQFMRENYKRLFLHSTCLQQSREIIQCKRCKDWFIGNHVFCPSCVNNNEVRIPEDLCNIRLLYCSNKGCLGKKEKAFATREDCTQAFCPHKSWRPNSTHVPVLFPTEVCAEFVRSGLIEDCAFLTQEELLGYIPIAQFWELHCSLLSDNARICYQKTGFEEVARKIGEINVMDGRSSIDVLMCISEKVRINKIYYESHKQGKLSIGLLFSRSINIYLSQCECNTSGRRDYKPSKARHRSPFFIDCYG